MDIIKLIIANSVDDRSFARSTLSHENHFDSFDDDGFVPR